MDGISRLTISHDGIDFPVLEAGEGVPLLLLHGGGSNAAHFAPLMRRIAPDFRVIAYDQRGFGGALVPDRLAVDHAHWASDVIGIMDSMGIERAHVLGWSFGCSVAINAAALRPDRVASLLLLGAPNPDRAVNVAALEERHARHARLEEDERSLRIREELADQIPEARRDDEALLDSLVASRTATPLVMQARTIAGYATRRDLRCVAQAVQCPAVVMTGEHDRISPPDAAAVLAEALGGATRTRIVSGCGHYLAAEDPELVARMVIAELETSASRSG